MKPEYILLICSGGVFLLLLLIYMLYAIEKSKSERRNKEKLIKSYAPEQLRKMEYDVSFYDKNVFHLKSNRTERQVTIDDILTEGTDDAVKLSEDAVFAQIEEGGVGEINGKFNQGGRK